jgi:hypothetical protein
MFSILFLPFCIRQNSIKEVQPLGDTINGCMDGWIDGWMDEWMDGDIYYKDLTLHNYGGADYAVSLHLILEDEVQRVGRQAR